MQAQVGDILEIRFAGSDHYEDYATLKSAAEVGAAVARVEYGMRTVSLAGLRAEFRIVRRCMGTTVILDSTQIVS